MKSSIKISSFYIKLLCSKQCVTLQIIKREKMKIVVVLAVLASFVFADLLLETAMQEGVITKITERSLYKDNKVAFEEVDSPVRTIIDLDTERYIMVNDRAKEYVDVSVDEFRQFITGYMDQVKAQLSMLNPGADYEAMKKKSEQQASQIQFKKNVQSKKILGMDAKVHQFILNGQVVGEIWTCQELMNKIKKEIDVSKGQKLLSEIEEMGVDMGIPSASRLAYKKQEKWLQDQGEIVSKELKSLTGNPYEKELQVLSNISEEALDASWFEVPAGYKKVTLERAMSQAWYAGENGSSGDMGALFGTPSPSAPDTAQVSGDSSQVTGERDFLDKIMGSPKDEEEAVRLNTEEAIEAGVGKLIQSLF